MFSAKFLASNERYETLKRFNLSQKTVLSSGIISILLGGLNFQIKKSALKMNYHKYPFFNLAHFFDIKYCEEQSSSGISETSYL